MSPASPYVSAATVEQARRFAFAASCAVAIYCALALVGWVLRVDLLISGLPGLPGAKFNAALALVLLAVSSALSLRLHRASGAAQALAAIAGLIGLLTLFQYMARVDLGIDELLIRDHLAPAGSHAGRMAPLSAMALVLLSLSLLLRRYDRRFLRTQQAAAVLPFVFGLLGTIGVIYHLHFLTGLGLHLAGMSAHTALALMVLSVAILAIEPDAGLLRIILANRSGGRFARRMLPIAILFPIVLGWLRMLGQELGYYDTSFGILIMVLSAIFVFSMIAVLSARQLNQSEEDLLDAQQALERRVQERTNDLETTVARLRAESVLREAAEASREESQALFRNALEFAPIGMAIVGLDGRWQQVNRALCEILGYDEASLLGLTFQDITHPGDLDADLSLLDSLVKGEIPHYQMEKRYIRKDGETVWTMLSVSLVRDAASDPLFFVSQVEDIAIRRQAEREVAASRQFFGDVINSIPIPLTVKDATGRIIVSNSAMADFHGRAADDLAGKADADLFPEAVAKVFRAEDQALLRSGEPFEQEQEFVTIAGKKRWVIKHKHRLPLSDGRHVVMTTLLDITGRRTAELALRDSEERFRSLTVLSSDWYWEQDENFRFTVQSGGADAAVKVPAGEILGKTRWEMPYVNMTKADWEQHRHHLESRRPFYDLELIRQLDDGSLRYAHVSGEPIFDSTGAFRGYRGIGRDITARRKAEVAAANSRKFLESVIEAIPEPVFLKDARHRWVLFNSAFCDLMRRDRVELLGQTDTLLFPPERVREVWAEDDAVFASEQGSLVVEEQGLPRADGSPRWLLKSKRRVTLPDDSTYIVGVSTDVSRLKETQEALRTSEELHRLLANNSSDLISLLTPAGSIQYASPASVTVLGHQPEQLVGRVVAEIIHPEDARQALQIFIDVVKTQAPIVFTCRLLRGNGSWSWIETSFRAIRDAQSGLTRQVIAVSRDINERVRVTNALNHFKYVLDNTLDMIFIYDVDSLRFNYVNDGAARALGIPRERLLGMAPWEVRADIQEKDYHKSIEPFLSGEIQSRQVETVHRRADGSIMPVEVTMQLIRRPGEIGTFISIARDLTERKKVEQMKNEFVSTVSHELRTPVTSIRGSLGLLAGGVAGKIPKQARQLIDIANSNSERLILLINDILDIEKIESGKMRFVMNAVRLRTLLHDALLENQGYAERFKVKFRSDGEIPDVMVRADRDRVLQVMANLLSNAAKFSPSGAEVQIAAVAGSGSVQISVTDHGSGIPAEFHDKIFGKFSQADASDSRRMGGSGLGLSIAKAIVEKHGGEIGFRTAPGKGTTFHFDLPLAIGATQEDSTAPRPASNQVH